MLHRLHSTDGSKVLLVKSDDFLGIIEFDNQLLMVTQKEM